MVYLHDLFLPTHNPQFFHTLLDHWIDLHDHHLGRSAVDEGVGGGKGVAGGEGAGPVEGELAEEEGDLGLFDLVDGQTDHCPRGLLRAGEGVVDGEEVRKLEDHFEVFHRLAVDRPDTVITALITDVNRLELRHQLPGNFHLVNASHPPQGLDSHPQEEDEQGQGDELPVGESEEVEQVCVGELSHYQYYYRVEEGWVGSQCILNAIINNIAVVSSMKDQILPEIPEENVPQAQSMYEQLRKTSQKWFTTGSHRRIFTNSALSPARPSPRDHPLFSDATQSRPGEWPEGTETPEKGRMVAVMREQIEIACSEYAGRFKGVLQEQARKIKLLGDLLVKNQIELDRKNKTIEGLVQLIEDRQDSRRNLGIEKVNAKVKENQQMMVELLKAIQRLQQRQGVSAKLKVLQKQYRDKLYKISSSYASKVGELSEQIEERIDKVEKVIALSQSEPKTNHRPAKDITPTLALSLQNLASDLEDLRQEVESFKRKKYKYENYKLEELRGQIEKIHEKIQKYEQAKLRASPNLKSSQATHATRTESNINIDTKYSQTSKSRFLNKYKSLISTRPAGPSHPRRKQSCSSESQSESEVEETLVDQENVDRLNRIIQEMRIRTPVRIEIDQTGYAKSVDTGMYLVDALGNGFQFSQQEIAQLTKGGVIAF